MSPSSYNSDPDCGEHHSALFEYEEALSLYSELAEKDPSYKSDMFQTLSKMANEKELVDEHEAALDYQQKADNILEGNNTDNEKINKPKTM